MPKRLKCSDKTGGDRVPKRCTARATVLWQAGLPPALREQLCVGTKKNLFFLADLTLRHALDSAQMSTSAIQFTSMQRQALKEQMQKHPTIAKFTHKERDELCRKTDLSKLQIRTWEKYFKRRHDKQAFLDREKSKASAPKGHARMVYATAFNVNRAFFERFLLFDDVPESANLRTVSYIEATLRAEASEGTFFICFESKVRLSTIYKYLIALGAGSVTMDCFGRANTSLSDAARALYNIQDTVRIRGASEAGHFKYGTVPARVEKGALRLLIQKSANWNA